MLPQILPTADFSKVLPAWHGLTEQYIWVMSGCKGIDPAIHSGPIRQTKTTYLHPVGEPVAFRVCALHCEQNIAPRNDAPFWHCLDFNGQVSIVFL